MKRPQFDALHIGAVAFLLLALLAGGSARADVFSSTIVRLAAIPLLGVAIWRLSERRLTAQIIWPTVSLVLLGLIGLAQLVPLPPSVWAQLPGHDLAAQTYRAAGLPAPWLPISLVPDATLNSLFSLLAPAAMFFTALTLCQRQRSTLLLTVLIVAMGSVVLGMFQLSSSLKDALHFYAITNADNAVGFFANRNHEASLLFASIPIAAWWAFLSEKSGRSASGFAFLVGLAVVLALVVGLVITRSRAAVIFGLVAVVASATMVFRSSSKAHRGPRLLALMGVSALAIALVAAYSLSPTLERFASDQTEGRWGLAPVVAMIGLNYAPFGSGLGSFEAVYQIFERTSDLGPSYWNHAHDDYLEIWMEAGWFGVATVVSGLLWFLSTAMGLWRNAAAKEPGWELGRVGALIIGLLALHSVVDYPLRTPALATLFALACALLIPPQTEPLAAPKGS